MATGDNHRARSFHINPTLRQGFRLDQSIVIPKNGEVIHHGKHLHLSPKAMEVLLYLTEHQGRLLSSEHLLLYGWGDKNASRSSLTHCISEIRAALDDHKECPEYIQTIRGKGYRLIAKVDSLDSKILYTNVFPLNSSPATKSNAPKEQKLDNHWHLSLALFKSSRLVSFSVAFVVSMWVLIQIFEVLFPIFDIPEWGLKIAMLVLVVGFPLVLLYIWLKEIKVRRELINRKKDERQRQFFFKQLAVDFTFIGVLSTLVGFLALHLIGSIENETAVQQEAAASQPIELPIKDDLVAVLPFDFNAAESLPAYFKTTLQDELIGALAHQADFRLVSRRAVNEIALDASIADYAKKLGARYLLDGTAFVKDDNLNVMLSLTDTRNALQVWTSTISGQSDNLLPAQKEIYRQVFNAFALLASSPAEEDIRVISTGDFKAYDSYIQGKDLLAKATDVSELRQAETLFLTALQVDPNFSLASAGLCQTYLDIYKFDSLVESFSAASQQCSQLLADKQLQEEGLIALGNLNRIRGDHLQAVDYYRKALEIHPQNLEAITGEAMSQRQLGNDESAEALFRRTIQLEPGYWNNYLNLGDFLFSIGNYKEASVAYSRVALLKPDFARAQNALGASYYMDEKFIDASMAWQKVVAKEPSGSAFSNLGTALFFSRQFEQAMASYQKAVELAPTDPILWGNLADSQKFAGNKSLARSTYQKALQLAADSLQVNPTDYSLLAMHARYQSELGECAQPLQQVGQLSTNNIDDPYLYYDLAVIAINCKELAIARRMTDAAVQYGYSVTLLAKDVQFDSLKAFASSR